MVDNKSQMVFSDNNSTVVKYWPEAADKVSSSAFSEVHPFITLQHSCALSYENLPTALGDS